MLLFSINNALTKVKNNKLIFLLFLLIFLKSLVWVYSFPVWQTPDERSHFGYVQFLAENKKIPIFKQDFYLSKEIGIATNILEFNKVRFHNNTTQSFKKNKRYGSEEKKLSQKKVLDNRVPTNTISNSDLEKLDIKDFSSRGYPPFYYTLAIPFYDLFYNSNIITRVEAVRFLSILISMIILFITYKLSGLFYTNKLFKLSIVAFVGFQPMYSMLSVSINPDILVILFITLLTYLLLKCIITNDIPTKDNVIISILLGLFFLTKQYALVGLAMYVISIAYLAFKNKKIYDYIKKILLSAIIIFLTSGWWYLMYMPKLFHSEQVIGFYEYISKYSSKYLGWVFDSYWGIFGWLDTTLNLKYYYLLREFTILSLIGFIAFSFNIGKKQLTRYLFLLSYVFIFFIFIIYLDSSYVMRGNSGIVQGRYFLIPIALTSILFIRGLSYLITKKYHIVFYWAIIYFSILFNYICLFKYIIPRYYV